MLNKKINIIINIKYPFQQYLIDVDKMVELRIKLNFVLL